MIEQCKGKDLVKVPKSQLHTTGWYVSVKYDGHYVQIHKLGNEVIFYTSGGKPFVIEYLAAELVKLNEGKDFIIEAEYIHNTDGKLGCRGKAAKLTTYRTNYEKGLKSGAKEGENTFKVFDCLKSVDMFDYEGFDVRRDSLTYEKRRAYLKDIRLPEEMSFNESGKTFYLNRVDLDSFIKKGYEGLMLKHKDYIYKPGKRVNDCIKLKAKPTADLKCINTEGGTGKYAEMIGALVLEDEEGRVVRVGSGLDDAGRAPELATYYIGKVVEIEYEQILDTYIQPVFKCVREDKSERTADTDKDKDLVRESGSLCSKSSDSK